MSNGDPDPEGPSADPEPRVSTYELQPGRLPFDSQLDKKHAWESGAGTLPSIPAEQPLNGGAPDTAGGAGTGFSTFDTIEPPPIVAATAAGSRDPRRAAAVAGLDTGARHNWVLSGPRNVGGRVPAFAVHPTDPRIMLAGAASGGVYRSTDAGESWLPLPFWNNLPSLAIGAIGFCRGTPQTIYVGTGENQTGGNEVIPGNGVYRSDDGGDTWVNQNAVVPPVPGAAPNQAFSFEAIAVHPTVPLHCWAVGSAGVFRTLDGGRTWTQFEAGVHYSDVAFSTSAGAGPHPILYLVRANANGAVVVRLDDPGGADQAAISAAANSTLVAASPAPAAPAPGVLQVPADDLARAKIAIAPSRPDVAYVRVVTAGGLDCNQLGAGGKHFGVFRTRNARNGPASGIAWQMLQDHIDWQCEKQGAYNLSLAVDPTDHNNVATGMVDFYVSRNANAAPRDVRWLRAMAWELYVLDRAHHGDHHAAVFAPQPGAAAGTPPALWVANDGGISRCLDWKTAAGYPGAVREPLGHLHPPAQQAQLTLPVTGVDGVGAPVAAAPMTWRKRSHGISAAQMYDLTQSPLVPTLYGCGFQDNGVFVTSGSETWHFALGADGAFVAFDPDDPYRFVASWDLGIDEVEFTGRLDGTFPVPGDPISSGLWPRELHEGLSADPAAFVSATAYHPRKSRRVLHARQNRLYGRPAQGETWQLEQVGGGVEISMTGGATVIEVQDSPGARALGLVPQVNSGSLRSGRGEPFVLAHNDQLALLVNGAARTITFQNGGAIGNLARASAAEVATYIRAAGTLLPAPSVAARPFFAPTGLTVEITTQGIGAAQQITLGGSALAPPGAGQLPRLGLLAGTYGGSPNRPAAVTLAFPGLTRADFARNRDLRNPVAGPPLELTVQINGGAVRHVPLAAPAFADPGWVRTGELAAALTAALAGDPAGVMTRTAFKLVRLTGTTAAGVQVTGTAADRLNMPAGAAFGFLSARMFFQRDQFRGQNAGNFNSWDLTSTGAPLQLVISDTVNVAPPLVFNAAVGAANLRCVTAEELLRIITAHLAGLGAAAPSVQVDLVEGSDTGTPRVIRYAESDPDTVWVGGDDGYLAVSKTDPTSWASVGDPRFRLRDRYLSAIAVHPTDPQTVYAGLAGRSRGTAPDTGFVFRTRDGGVTWNPVSTGLVDSVGVAVGVNALEIDTGAPATVFAATDVGVFRSTDSGDHWAPFNEGLPNVLMRDLAFSPALRTLRVGAWGRGVYERHVGDRPAGDVHLYVRQNGLDDGSSRPAPDGPDPFSPTPRQTGADAPDIKVNRDRPPLIGADDLVDGVEFDEDIVHEEPVAGHGNVFVQVHNRGAFPATDVRLVALWADAANGPPPLPADFWTKFAAAGVIDPALGSWTLIGDSRSSAGAITVQPGYPRVHTFGVDWPDGLDDLRRIGIVLLVSSAEDPLAQAALDLPTLLAIDTKIGYRETAVARRADDHTLFLQQTGPVQFTLANPAAGTSAAPALGILAPALGPATSELRAGSEPFNLTPAPQALTFSTPAQTITVAFVQGPNDIPNLGAATALQVAAVLNREFLLAGMPVRASEDPIATPPPPNNFRLALALHGSLGSTVAVAPPGVPDAAPALGLAAGPPANILVGGTEPFVIPPGSALQVTATNTTTIQLAAADFVDPVHATAREVRRALNRGLAVAQLTVRASIPKVELRIRRSSTDADGAPAAVAGRRLADLAWSGAAVAAAARPALFGFLEMLKQPLVQASHDGFLYLRTANLGTAAEPAARHRVYQLALGSLPAAPAPIGAAVAAAVPAGGSAIVELPWNPGAVAAGDRLFVLAVADVDADHRRLDPPANFTSVEEVDAFCDANPNVAYREFTVFV